MSDVDRDAPMSLRERRRVELHQAITAATLDLFEERGVEGTTVGDIAAAVGISTRTFFRYFPSKEVAAVSGQDAFDEAGRALLDTLQEGEPLLTQLVAAYRAAAAKLDDSSGETRRQLVRARRLLMANPAIHAASLHSEECGNIAFADAITERMQLEGGLHEARIAVSMATYALRLAFDEWVRTENDPSAPALPALYDRMTHMLARVAAQPDSP